MADYNPSDHSVQQVLDHLEGASGAEAQKILDAEKAGKGRKTILEAYGMEPDGDDVRRDASGRVLYPWEVSPEGQESNKLADMQVEDGQETQNAGVATEQGGTTPAGTGVADPGTAEADTV